MNEKKVPLICPRFYVIHGNFSYCGCMEALDQGKAEIWKKGKYILKICNENIVKARSRPYYLSCRFFSNWYWQNQENCENKILKNLEEL